MPTTLCRVSSPAVLGSSLQVLPLLSYDFKEPSKCARPLIKNESHHPFARNLNPNVRVNGNSGRQDGARNFSFSQYFNSHLSFFYLKGFSLNIHPQYVGEISPKKLRGFTNSTVSVFLTLGKLTGQVVGLR